MPDSDYTATPPAATSQQSLMLMDKITEMGRNLEKLATKIENMPLQLDRLAAAVENLGRENEKTRHELERTQNHLEQNIEKIEKDIDANEKQLTKTLQPLIDNKTATDTLTSWLKAGGVALIVAIYTGWTTMSTRMEALTLQQQSTGQTLATIDETVREGRAARLAATARIEMLEKQYAQMRAAQ